MDPSATNNKTWEGKTYKLSWMNNYKAFMKKLGATPESIELGKAAKPTLTINRIRNYYQMLIDDGTTVIEMVFKLDEKIVYYNSDGSKMTSLYSFVGPNKLRQVQMIENADWKKEITITMEFSSQLLTIVKSCQGTILIQVFKVVE